MFAPELNVALMENRTHPPRGEHEQQVWTYRFAQAGPSSSPSVAVRTPARPRIVEDAVVSVRSARQVDLAWTASREKDIIGYSVERANAEVLTEDQLKRLKSRTPPLPEASVGAIIRIGSFQRITSSRVTGTMFSDTSVDLTKPARVDSETTYQRNFNADQLDEGGNPYRFAVFAYRVRAVNASRVASGPSPVFFTIPSAPQFVFSREDGTTSHLQWKTNPEQGMTGYRIYRMDGRFDSAKISRLTDEPIASSTYSDPTAGKDTRRYYVVAVDALGQEGFPSSPVWFNREWRQFYAPFVGEWHQ